MSYTKQLISNPSLFYIMINSLTTFDLEETLEKNTAIHIAILKFILALSIISLNKCILNDITYDLIYLISENIHMSFCNKRHQFLEFKVILKNINRSMKNRKYDMYNMPSGIIDFTFYRLRTNRNILTIIHNFLDLYSFGANEYTVEGSDIYFWGENEFTVEGKYDKIIEDNEIMESLKQFLIDVNIKLTNNELIKFVKDWKNIAVDYSDSVTCCCNQIKKLRETNYIIRNYKKYNFLFYKNLNKYISADNKLNGKHAEKYKKKAEKAKKKNDQKKIKYKKQYKPQKRVKTRCR